jgi:hypothetical protein
MPGLLDGEPGVALGDAEGDELGDAEGELLGEALEEPACPACCCARICMSASFFCCSGVSTAWIFGNCVCLISIILARF